MRSASGSPDGLRLWRLGDLITGKTVEEEKSSEDRSVGEDAVEVDS